MVLNLQRVSLPAIGADFRLRLDLSQLSPQGGDVHPDQFAARVFLAPDAPGDFLRGDPLPPPAHEQLDDLIFAVAQVHAAGGCPKFKCLRVQRHVAPRQRLRGKAAASSGQRACSGDELRHRQRRQDEVIRARVERRDPEPPFAARRQQQQRRRHARVAKPADPFRRVFAKLFSPRRGENSPFHK